MEGCAIQWRGIKTLRKKHARVSFRMKDWLINKSKWFCILIAGTSSYWKFSSGALSNTLRVRLCTHHADNESSFLFRILLIASWSILEVVHLRTRGPDSHKCAKYSTKRQQNTSGISKNNQQHTHKSYNALQEVANRWQLLPLLCQHNLFSSRSWPPGVRSCFNQPGQSAPEPSTHLGPWGACHLFVRWCIEYAIIPIIPMSYVVDLTWLKIMMMLVS